MTTIEKETLARRAVACEGWRWIPGMRARQWAGDRPWFRVADGSRHTGNMEPDLDDPATLGCLLALVREAWGMPDAHTVMHRHPRGEFWWSMASVGNSTIATDAVALAKSEVEAIVAALEAAPV